MKKRTVTLDTINRKKAEIFFSRYNLKLTLDSRINKNLFLGEKKPKICRFCSKTSNETNFKKDAHVIPQLLGNRKILSYFECDNCNDLFSKYEDSLASYIGPFRTIVGIIGKKGTQIPKFKDPKSKLTISSPDTKNISINTYGKKNEIELDESNKIITLNLIRQSYYPIDVYKSLVKIGICMLDDVAVCEYKSAIKFLLDSDGARHVHIPIAKLYYYFISGPSLVERPHVELWEKKNIMANKNVVKHTIIIRLPNLIFQIFLPFNSKDREGYNPDTEIQLPLFPLLYDYEWLKKYNQYKAEVVDLSSKEKLKEPPIKISFKYAEAIKDDLP